MDPEQIKQRIFELRRQVELELAHGTTARAQELLDTIRKLETGRHAQKPKEAVCKPK